MTSSGSTSFVCTGVAGSFIGCRRASAAPSPTCPFRPSIVVSLKRLADAKGELS